MIGGLRFVESLAAMRTFLSLFHITFWIALAFAGLPPGIAQGALPAPVVEISEDHPLFLFAAPEPAGGVASDHGAAIVEVWNQLADVFKPYSVLLVEAQGDDGAKRHLWLRLRDSP